MQEQEYKRLREVIISSNPEIMDGGSGCYECGTWMKYNRPIRLADVLLKMSTYWEFDKYLDNRVKLLELWSFRDDNLDHQEDETKQFLIDLLV